jgi:hypothetical protein
LGFIDPFYNALFWFLPNVLALLAGTLLLFTISILVEIIPSYGGLPLKTIFKYAIYALIIANTVYSIFSIVSIKQFSDLFFANVMILLVMVLGIFLYSKLRAMKNIGWLFGYYGLWIWFFAYMGILTALPGFNITGSTWMMMLPWAFAELFGVALVQFYKKEKKEFLAHQPIYQGSV